MLATLLAWLSCAAVGWVAATVSMWIAIAAVGPLGLWAFVLYFFRDPERAIPDGDGLFVCPADGRIADITPLGIDSPLGCAGLRIGVFMNLHNVHVNRMPCDATIESIDHCPGTFINVQKRRAWERNESTTLRLRYDSGGQAHTIVVRQIAGLVARRIVTSAAEGESVSRGQRFGMIRFGSRLELLLPDTLGVEPLVACGQKVYAGSTVLAREPNDK